MSVSYSPPSSGGIPGVTVTGTPAASNVLTATSPTTATWDAPEVGATFTVGPFQIPTFTQ